MQTPTMKSRGWVPEINIWKLPPVAAIFYMETALMAGKSRQPRREKNRHPSG